MKRGRSFLFSLVVLTAAVACASALGPTEAAADEAAPAWEISQVTTPTTLVPGTSASSSSFNFPAWTVILTNVGAKAFGEAGSSVVDDTLPNGVTVAPGEEAVVETFELGQGEGGNRIVEPCSVSGQLVTCDVTHMRSPGESVEIVIPLAVAPTTSSSVTNQVSVSGGGAPPASGAADATVGPTLPTFGFVSSTGLQARAFDLAGAAPDVAGSHPFMLELNTEFNSKIGSRGASPVQALRNLLFDLPGGVVADPAAVPVRCRSAELTDKEVVPVEEASCPAASQVGVVRIEVPENARSVTPLFAMVPSPGHAAEFGFDYDAVGIHIQGGLGSDLHLTAEASELLSKFPIVGIDTFLWGVPADPHHDPLRYGQHCTSGHGCPMEPPSLAPFLTMPSSCTETPELEGVATSWSGAIEERKVALADRDGNPVNLTGCESLRFEPSFEAKPTTQAAEQPSGLDVTIHQPQDESLQGRATAKLKDAEVVLPEGMVLNAAAGNGLSACTEEQIGYAPEDGKVRFAAAPQSCPNAAKVGTLKAKTPLLEEVLAGGVYVAKPFDNPFSSLLAVYLAIENKKLGIYTKLAGKVESDPVTGRLTATFTENPELPIEDIEVSFFSGESATLTTPLPCGTKTTAATLTPWSTPEGADAHLTSSFQTSSGCAASEGQASKGYFFRAGTINPLSGAYSPFVLKLSRGDGTQHITGLETTLPEGLLGKLAGVSYCPESGIDQARSREAPEKGKEEQGSPSCPSSSEVGTVNVTAGSGSNPIPVSGHAYLAGPYEGAPLSLVVIVPAVAGPFDLGTVVDRVALKVGEYDAKIHAVADRLPTIRDGIPLDVRSIELKLDRPSFTLNPTSCEVKTIEGSVSTQAGQSQTISNRFQVGDCERLAFRPKLKLELKGATKRTGLPAVKATVTYPTGDPYANIAKAQVALPHSEFLEQSNFNKTCTKPVVQAGTCPASSIYGKARAWSPLLEKPLEGPVYLVGGYGYKLPALVAELNGQIRLLLVGKVDTGKNGGIRNTFEAVPDAPVEKFVLELKGGKKYGLLTNSENLCKKTQKAEASFSGENGRFENSSVTVANSCGRKGKKSAGKKHKKGANGNKHNKGKKSTKSSKSKDNNHRHQH
jgi:hypothetical protein